MSHPTKRILSTTAIIIASVAFGVLITADLGFVRQSQAQQTTMVPATTQGPVTTVTIPSFADLAARVMPAVVSITTTEIVHTSEMVNPHSFGGVDPFDFFFGPNPRTPRTPRGRGNNNDNQDDARRQLSGGSGFIISPDGYILTNNHVVDDASKVQVHFGADENGNGGHTVTARIVGRDPSTDIALLKIEAGEPLPFVNLGDSDRARKGDWAIAIGNPFQFENTLTVGVISAKGRALGLSEQTRSFENFIQTDAAINFGNSGGPLLNINGEVVGINTAIRGGAQGLGFATPINTAKRLIPQLKQGKVVRGYLGMSITEVTEQYKNAFNLPDARGALVQSVEPGKPADKAGVRQGDVVIEIDGKPIQNNRQLIDYISYLPIGTNVKIGVIRGGQRVALTAKTEERPTDGTAEAKPSEGTTQPTHNKLGLSIQDLTPAIRQTYSIPDNIIGVVVTNVRDVSPAGEAGFSEGDVITELQGQKLTSVEQFRRLLDTFKSGQWIRLYVTTATRAGRPLSTYRALQIP
jgi:serine protease Do